MEKDILVFVRIHNDGQASKWLCLDIEDTRILLFAIPLCIIFAADARVCLFSFFFRLLLPRLDSILLYVFVDDGEY